MWLACGTQNKNKRGPARRESVTRRKRVKTKKNVEIVSEISETLFKE